MDLVRYCRRCDRRPHRGGLNVFALRRWPNCFNVARLFRGREAGATISGEAAHQGPGKALGGQLRQAAGAAATAALKLIPLNFLKVGCRRVFLCHAAQRLTFIRGEGRHINETNPAGMFVALADSP